MLEYDEKSMLKPAFDLILGVKTMKKLGIVLDFLDNKIQIDHVCKVNLRLQKLGLSTTAP